MRRLLLLAFVAPVVVLSACEDSSNENIAIDLPDSSLPDSGGGGGGNNDGSVGTDGGSDAATDSPTTLPVTVLVTSATAPKAGVRVIVHDATGAVFGEKTTDATGLVSFVATPSMVTVLDSVGATSYPVTFTGVEAGDNLKVVETAPFDETLLGVAAVSISANAITAKANTFDVYFNTSCSNSGPSNANGGPSNVSVNVYATCGRALNNVYARAMQPTGSIGWGAAKNLAPPAGGNTVAVGPLTIAAYGTRSFAFTNLGLLTRTQVRTAQGYAIAGPDAFDLDSSGIDANATNFPVPVGFPDAYETSLGLGESHDGGNFTSRFIRREAATADNSAALTTTDFSQALPPITSVALSEATVGRPELTFGFTGATNAHSAVANVAWGSNVGSGRWTVVFAGDQKTIKFPALPPDATAFVPQPGAVIALAAYVDGTAIPDYATAKKLPIPSNTPLELITRDPALAKDSTLKVSSFRPLTR